MMVTLEPGTKLGVLVPVPPLATERTVPDQFELLIEDRKASEPNDTPPDFDTVKTPVEVLSVPSPETVKPPNDPALLN